MPPITGWTPRQTRAHRQNMGGGNDVAALADEEDEASAAVLADLDDGGGGAHCGLEAFRGNETTFAAPSSSHSAYRAMTSRRFSTAVRFR